MEILHTKETLVLCPYNSAHHIRKYRMERHLVKCRRNYPDSDLVKCDFNSIHEVPQPELEYHHEHCPDRKMAELAIFKESDSRTSLKIPKPMNLVNFPSEEWEEEEEQSYDPERYCATHEILRNISVQSAAKRRHFRTMERNRFLQLRKTQELKEQAELNQVEELEEQAELNQVELEEHEKHICQLMEKLSTAPSRAVIPKISREVAEFYDNTDVDLEIKKNN